MHQPTFDDRYGDGAFARLLALLEKPCVTFADIATLFGVTRERVRQWHRDLRPDAPAGRVRRRACAVHQQRRRLLADPVFRAFAHHARQHLGPGCIEPIPTRHGYRARLVAVGSACVALREASAATQLPRYRGVADFLYVLLPDDEFVLARCGAADPGQTGRNTFAALAGAATAPQLATPPHDHAEPLAPAE